MMLHMTAACAGCRSSGTCWQTDQAMAYARVPKISMLSVSAVAEHQAEARTNLRLQAQAPSKATMSEQTTASSAASSGLPVFVSSFGSWGVMAMPKAVGTDTRTARRPITLARASNRPRRGAQPSADSSSQH